MIGKLNHVAIVVPDLAAAISQYRDLLGAKVTQARDVPDHGARVASVVLENTQIELLQPFGDNSPFENFLITHPGGGIHHVSYQVTDICATRDKLLAEGARILGGHEPRPGTHGNPVLFLHPKDFSGTLIELEQIEG